MLASTGVRRTVALRARVENQRRFGGSLSKNKHIENYSNWRGDSEKRFKFDGEFFTSMAAWGVIPFTIYYAVASGERHNRDRANGITEKNFQ
uniref:NADH dehydrogenase [ubiquinone] 1 beta subcomplex subunit 4 n=1 Tax=Globisporangium ultimum (strain ATCC 200006 / CBS 805.95 / DAOM BR144) TaxID=431595 RepID=K3WV28_GLOUD